METVTSIAREPVDTDSVVQSIAGIEAYKRRAVRGLAVSTSLCVIGYLGVAMYVGHVAVRQTFTQAGIAAVAVALGLSVLSILIRFMRWRMFFAVLGEHIPARADLQIYLAGLGLLMTPAKAGIAIRSVFLKRLGIGYSKSLAAFLGERFCDLVGLLLIAASGAALHSAAPVLLALIALISLGFLLIVRRAEHLESIRERSFERNSHWSTFIGHAVSMVIHCGQCLRAKCFLMGVALGVMANLAHALALYNMLFALGANIDARLIAVVFALSTLAGSLSMLPAGLGSAEAAMLALLVAAGIEPPSAVAATLFSRLTSLWFTVLLGVIALFSLGWRRTAEAVSDTHRGRGLA